MKGGASAAGAVFRPDLSPAALDDGARDRQSEPGALLLGRVERIEDLVERVLGNAGAGIAYRHFYRDFSDQRRLDGYPAGIWCGIGQCIHRIRHQDQDHLLQVDPIGPHRQGAAGPHSRAGLRFASPPRVKQVCNASAIASVRSNS